jgi:hypothetical protein
MAGYHVDKLGADDRKVFEFAKSLGVEMIIAAPDPTDRAALLLGTSTSCGRPLGAKTLAAFQCLTGLPLLAAPTRASARARIIFLN